MSQSNQPEAASQSMHSLSAIVDRAQPALDGPANRSMQIGERVGATHRVLSRNQQYRPISPLSFKTIGSVNEPNGPESIWLPRELPAPALNSTELSNGSIRATLDALVAHNCPTTVVQTAGEDSVQGQAKPDEANRVEAFQPAKVASRAARKRRHPPNPTATWQSGPRTSERRVMLESLATAGSVQVPELAPQEEPEPDDHSVILYRQPKATEHFTSYCAHCHESLKGKLITKCERCPFVFEANKKCDAAGFQRQRKGTILRAPSRKYLHYLCIHCQNKEEIINAQKAMKTWDDVSPGMVTKYLNCLNQKLIFNQGNGKEVRPLYTPIVKGVDPVPGPLYDLSNIYELYKHKCPLDQLIDLKTMDAKEYGSFGELFQDVQHLEYNIKVLNKHLPRGERLLLYVQDMVKAFKKNTDDIAWCPSCFGSYFDEPEERHFIMPCNRLHTIIWWNNDNHWWIGKLFRCRNPRGQESSDNMVNIKLFCEKMNDPNVQDHPPIRVPMSELWVYSVNPPTRQPVDKQSLLGFDSYLTLVKQYFHLAHKIPKTAVPFTKEMPFFWEGALNEEGLSSNAKALKNYLNDLEKERNGVRS